MNQNVTLSINSNVLQQASDYARSKGTDLSELVENLLKQVTGSKQKEKSAPFRNWTRGCSVWSALSAWTRKKWDWTVKSAGRNIWRKNETKDFFRHQYHDRHN